MGLFLVEALGYLAFQYARWLLLSVSIYPKFLIQPQIYGVADHPNLLAGLINLAPCSPSCGWRGLTPCALWPHGVRPVSSGALYLLAATVVLFYTQSRGLGGLLAAIGVVLLPCSLHGLPHRHAWRAWLATTRSIWLTLGAYLAVFLVLAARTRASTSEYTGNAGGFTAGRSILWQVAWDSFMSRPLTGTGPLTFTRQYMDTVPSSVPTRIRRTTPTTFFSTPSPRPAWSAVWRSRG